MFGEEKVQLNLSTIPEEESSVKSVAEGRQKDIFSRPSRHQSLQNVSESQGDFNLALAAHALETPKLDSLEIYGIKQFILKYEDYQIRCPNPYLKLPQFCIRSEFLEIIAVENEMEMEELFELGIESFWNALASMHNVLTEHEYERRFRKLSMQSDDLRTMTLSNYNKAWQWEELFAGSKIVLPDRFMAKIYWEGLRPVQLKEKVGRNHFLTVSGVQALTTEALKVLRVSKEQASLFLPNNSGNPLGQKTGGSVLTGNSNQNQQNVQRFHGKGGPYTPNTRDTRVNPAVAASGGAVKRVVETRPKLDLAKVTCFNCGQKGHFANKCSNPRVDHVVGRPEKLVMKKLVEKVDGAVKKMEISVDDFQPVSESDRISSILEPKDHLFRLPCSVVDKEQVISLVSGAILLDSGCNLDIISQDFLRRITRNLNGFFIVVGSPLQLDLATREAKTTVSGERIELELEISLHDHHLRVKKTFLIVPDIEEDFIFGIHTLMELGLLGYMQLEAKNRVETIEESFIASYELGNNLFPIGKVTAEQVFLEPEPVSKTAVSDVSIPKSFEIDILFPDFNGLSSLLEEFGPKLFSGFDSIGLLVDPLTVSLKPGTSLAKQTVRYLAPNIMLQLKLELERLQREGILVPCNTAIGCSPLVIVPKPDGNIRMAVDYRQLNTIIEDFAGNIPGMKSLFPYLANKCYFAKLDNLWGYHQLKVKDTDQDLLAIITPFGLFKWTRCPFGISTAPGVYQDRMANVILKDLMYICCVVYIDDTIVFGATPQEFLSNLRRVFEKFVQFNVRLKLEKCKFGYQSTEFVGHIFDKNGYRLSEERKQGLQDLMPPQSVKQVRSFIGMVNYFRDFIPNLSSHLTLLTALTRKDIDFVWGDAEQEAFDHLKTLIWNSATLSHLEPVGDVTLFTDASVQGIGAVLMQKDEKGINRPILFLSQKFSQSAQNWSTIEQECYAVFYSIITLRSYLLGRHFFVATDHRNLMFLEKSVVPKLIRWRLRLLEFQFTICHVPGVTNVIADQLSRLLKIVSVDGVEVETYSIFLDYHNDIVGHHGINQTIQLLNRGNKYWKGRFEDIRTFISQCPICQKVKSRPIPDLILTKYHIHGTYPMENLSVDSVGPLPEDENGNKFILVIIDNFSKYVTLYATKSTTAVSYCQALVHHMGIFGICSKIRSDGGSQFTADICRTLATLFGFTHHVILAYHPQANGIVERKNAEVMKHLRALILVRQDKDRWSQYLPIVQRILNSTLDFDSKICPSELIFGNQLPILMPLMVDQVHMENTENIKSYVYQISSAMSKLVLRSQDFLKIRTSDSPIIDNSEPIFNVGDYCLITYPTRAPHKLSPLYRGPYLIVKKIRDDIVSVKDLLTSKILDFHVSRLRVFKKSEDTIGEDFLKLAAADRDEFIVEFIVDHRGSMKKPSKLEFKVRWQGYEESEDTWEPYQGVKELSALDDYLQNHPEI